MSLTIRFYDVEHGSCSHIITPKNQHILIDLGTKKNKSICKYLKDNYFSNGKTIDYLILTHLHEDHIKDIPQLDTYNINPRMINIPREAFNLSYTEKDTYEYKAIVKKANELNEKYTCPVDAANDVSNPQNNGGITMQIFSPENNYYDKNDPNSYSRVIIFTYAKFKFVFTGDNPAKILSTMIDKDDFKSAISDATVLVAPHHGRDNEFCEGFMNIVNPLLTVFSDDTIKFGSQEYSAQKYRNKTRGCNYDGDRRYVFTTRNDGTITFTLCEDGKWSIGLDKNEY